MCPHFKVLSVNFNSGASIAMETTGVQCAGLRQKTTIYTKPSGIFGLNQPEKPTAKKTKTQWKTSAWLKKLRPKTPV